MLLEFTWSNGPNNQKGEKDFTRGVASYKNKKVDCFGRSPWFSKVLDLQKLTGRLLRTLDIRIMGDGPFNQLSDTKLMLQVSERKSNSSRF
jgi:hypothetical protein